MENNDLSNIAEYKPHSRHRNDAKGVWWIEVKISADGDITEKETLLSSPMDVIGHGTDEQGKGYTVIQYTDQITKQRHVKAISRSEIGTIKLWQELQSNNINIYNGRTKREHLADYLQITKSPKHYHITKKTGWYKGAYILPNGNVIQNDDAQQQVIFVGDTSKARFYHESGSLNDWRDNVAKYADGNSRLCLALGTAFAAPLLDIMKMESGGFHLHSNSTDGKTTTTYVALSVWGQPEEIKTQWRATPYAITNAACANNHNILVLDEIGQAHAKDVADTAYNLGNGQGKLQGDKDGGNRSQVQFKILFLSTGEKSIETYVRMGDAKLWNAGQEIRLPSIKADVSTHGAFENIHSFPDGWHFAQNLTQSFNKYYGTAGIAFIQALIKQPNIAETITGSINDFMHHLSPDVSAQVKRVAKRFALVAAALELAGQYGITGLNAGVGFAGVQQCFKDWLAENGTGRREDKQILQNYDDFMARYAHSKRFVRFNDFGVSDNHAGYFDDSIAPVQYFVIPPVFEQEIAQSYSILKVIAVLEQHNRFIHGKRGKGKTQRKVKGASQDFYVVVTPIDADDD